jgi:aryl-alcohol dehydrogenase-like predicted oxidoreductase
MQVMDDLVRSGKVRYVGCSNYPAWRLVEALWASDRSNLVSYVSLQPHYNLVHRAEFERDLAEVVRTHQLGVIPYSPLGGGFLTGKYRRDDPLPEGKRAQSVEKRYFSEQNFRLLDVMKEIGREHGKDIPQVALGWLLTQPLVTAPIVGANTVKQLDASLDAVGFRLSPDEMERLNESSAWQEK